MTFLAGAFIAAFGAGGAWLLTAKFPAARFLRLGYALMAVGGVAFAVWGATHLLYAGIAAMALLAVGGILGIVGAMRKELRPNF